MVSRPLAAVIVACAAILGVVSGVPTVWSPLNVLGFVPAIWASLLFGRLAILAPVPMFVAAFGWWCPSVWTGDAVVPKRSRIAAPAAMALSATSLVFGRSYGLRYQGAAYVNAVTVASILWWVLVLGVGVAAIAHPSVRRNLWFHVALFAWLAWYSVPYMGELP